LGVCGAHGRRPWISATREAILKILFAKAPVFLVLCSESGVQRAARTMLDGRA